jgi:hypothetical protein
MTLKDYLVNASQHMPLNVLVSNRPGLHPRGKVTRKLLRIGRKEWLRWRTGRSLKTDQ